jgi:ribosome-associated protein
MTLITGRGARGDSFTSIGGQALELLDTARLILDAIASKMGSDIVLLDLSQVTLIADYFIIATGESDRQLDALAQSVLEEAKQGAGLQPLSVQGTPASGWTLIDFGSIVVHLFSPGQRKRYQLEEFWSNARTVVRIA